MHAINYLLKNNACNVSQLSISSSSSLNTRNLRQHRLSPNLESYTIQPVHETLPKTSWSEDTTPSKVKVIL